MSEFFYGKIRNFLYKIEAKLERNKNGYIDKLPKDIHYFEGGLYDAVYESACKYPHNIAIEYFETQFTYKDLIKKINKVASALKASGVEKGERVTICMPNTPEAVYMFYAVNEVGAVANMIHPLSSEKEIEEYLNRAHSKIILCIDISYPKVEAIIKNTDIEQVIVVSATRSMSYVVRFVYWITKGRKNHIKKSQHVITWNKFLARAGKFIGNPHTRVNSKDPAVILYSGGTTGKPKGVVCTNLNFNSQALGAKYLVPELLRSRYSMLCFLPNFHAFGLGVCMHIPLYCGMRMVLIPQFNAKKLKNYIKRYNINILVGVPTVFDFFTRIKFGKNDLRHIKGVVSGGDMINQSTKDKINRFLRAHGSKAIIHNGYGLTEASGGMIFSPASIAKESDVIGYPLPDSEVLILDPKTNKEAPIGEPGEILVRGLTVMKEYLNNPRETANAFTTFKNKKWLRTGDIGYVGAKGAVYFKGRIKRMIITNGYNVYPTNVEDATLKSKLVEKCAVLGVPDQLRGERVKAFVVLKKDVHERTARKDLARIYRQYLAKYETPREISFIADLPKTKLGKVDYQALAILGD
ncbi:acyl--CoA ligase [Candidatus Saccharibacteria bacterium]|nr:acyl--CoA ligase [Candidatus Saccharibacteria bacterium]